MSTPTSPHQVPSASTGRRTFLLFLLGAFVLNVFVMYLNACVQLWESALVMSGVAFVVFAFMAVPSILREPGASPAKRWGYTLALLVYGAVMLGSSYHLVNLYALVHVDNASQPVTVELDGKPWLTARLNATRTVRLVVGSYTLTVRAQDGTELERRKITVTSHKEYILNIQGAMAYYRTTAKYASFGGGHSDGVHTHNAWFEPTEDYLFQAPPDSLRVRHDTGSVTLTYLRRASKLPQDWGGEPAGWVRGVVNGVYLIALITLLCVYWNVGRNRPS